MASASKTVTATPGPAPDLIAGAEKASNQHNVNVDVQEAHPTVNTGSEFTVTVRGNDNNAAENSDNAVVPNGGEKSTGQSSKLLTLPDSILIGISKLLPPEDFWTFKHTSRRLRGVLRDERGGNNDFLRASPKGQFFVDAFGDACGFVLKNRLPCYYCNDSHPPSMFNEHDQKPGDPLRICKGARRQVELACNITMSHRQVYELLQTLQLTQADIAANRYLKPCDKFILSGPSLHAFWGMEWPRDMSVLQTQTYINDMEYRARRFAIKFPGARAFLQGKRNGTIARLQPFCYALADPACTELRVIVTYEIELLNFVYGAFPTVYYLSRAEDVIPNTYKGDKRTMELLNERFCPHLAFDHPTVVSQIYEAVCYTFENFDYWPSDVALNSHYRESFYCPQCQTAVYLAGTTNPQDCTPMLIIKVVRDMGNGSCASNWKWMRTSEEAQEESI